MLDFLQIATRSKAKGGDRNLPKIRIKVSVYGFDDSRRGLLCDLG